MPSTEQIKRALEALRMRLHYVNRAWTADDYEALLRFFVESVPRLMDAERCAVFIVEPSSGRVVSKLGTGLGEHEIEAPREGSIVGRAIAGGESVIENDLAALAGFHRTADRSTGFATRSAACAPIRSLAGGPPTGAVEVLNKRGGPFTEADLGRLQEIADYLALVIENLLANAEILRLSEGLGREVSELRSAYLGDVPFVAASESMRGVLELVRLVSETPVSVVIQGENGTGKEVIARMIHERGQRRDRAFVAVNCAAIPETLMESEFFGYEKGAFTGAQSARPGRFEEASGGTLFLDEIGDLPLGMQPKLLRAIQEGEGSRLGGNQVRTYDARIVSATNRDLAALVAEGRFREDLYYRLFAVEVHVPPLRERREDIAPLALAFVGDVCRRYGRSVQGCSTELLALFESCPWPGNVRQLRREVERLVALTPEGQQLTPERCSPELRAASGGAAPGPDDARSLPDQVRALEVALIRRALERTGGNKLRAAELLGITRQGLHKKLRRYAEPPPGGGGGDAGEALGSARE